MRLLALVAISLTALGAPAVAGAPSAVTHSPGWDDYAVGWSPDGKLIQLESEWSPPKDYANDVVRLVALDGTASRTLPKPYAEWDRPGAWSPDGKRFVMPRGTQDPDAANDDLYLFDGAGQSPRDVTRTTDASEDDPHWRPDGSAIAYTRTVGLDENELWTMRADGTGQRRLATGGAAADWSPEGSRIAFTRPPTPPEPINRELWVMNADGSGQRRVVDRGALPQWSPDGTRLAYLVYTRGVDVLWVVGADGTGRRKVADDVDETGWLWAPTGDRLLVERGGSAGKPALSFVDLSSGAARPLVDGSHPTYSRDGKWLAFDRGSVPGARAPDGVFVIRPDGTGLRRLATGLLNPSWSPDGRLLAADGYGPCLNGGVYVIAVATASARRLTNDCRITGTAGADVLDGTTERDVIRGLGGNDVIHANPGDRPNAYYGRLDDDRVDAGPGNDVVYAARGTDVVLGGPGDDRLDGGRGADRLSGGPGNDTLTGGRYFDRLSGGAGNDRILARDGFKDRIACGPGRDTVDADRHDVVARDCEVVRRR